MEVANARLDTSLPWLRHACAGSNRGTTDDEDVVANYNELKAYIASRHLPTAAHSNRVRIRATALGLGLSLAGLDMMALSIAADIHDVGKLAIPVSTLDKESRLTEQEWALINRHPEWGYKMAALAFPSLPEVADCILLHHERLDGSGYPCGLTAADIPMLSRIVAVADVFTALTEDHPFRPAYTESEALTILMRDEESQFDQRIVGLLVELQRATPAQDVTYAREMLS